MTELDFSIKVLNRLSKDFYIQKEVWGTHFTGKKYRVDAVIKPKQSNLWARKDIAFGIEFKKPEAYLDCKIVSSMIRQSYNYLYTDFQGYGNIPLLVCPLKIQNTYCKENEMSFIKRLLGRFGIGEIVNTKDYRGLAIIFQENEYVWCEKHGVMKGKSWEFNFQ
jgi:hypothetical protein